LTELIIQNTMGGDEAMEYDEDHVSQIARYIAKQAD